MVDRMRTLLVSFFYSNGYGLVFENGVTDNGLDVPYLELGSDGSPLRSFGTDSQSSQRWVRSNLPRRISMTMIIPP